MKILCIVNDKYSPPGVVGNQLQALGSTLQVISPHAGVALPDCLPADVGGVLVLGGIMHAFEDDKYPWLADITRLMAEAHKARVPVLGICLGAQLLARALGQGRVTMPAYEFGFVALEKTVAGQSDALLRDVDVPEIMQGHEDNFTLPDGAELLLTGDFCRNQAFRAGPSSYGFQCHFEVTEDLVLEWVRQARTALADRLGDDPQGHLDTIIADAPKKLPDAAFFAKKVTTRWLDLVAARSAMESV